jgi:predicted RNA binding protein YcfA (HicA-like mRNA interferase family)
MSKLPSITGEKAKSAFEQLGFYEVRVKGSHHVMKRDGHRFLLSIPIHGGENLKPGTLRSLIRAAGITVEQFQALL